MVPQRERGVGGGGCEGVIDVSVNVDEGDGAV